MNRKASKWSQAVRLALALGFVLTLSVGCLMLTFAAVASFAPRTGAQKPTSSNRPSSKTMPEARAKRHPSPRELLFSEDPNAEIGLGERLRATTKPSRETERDIELAKNFRVQSASNQQQSASAQNPPSHVRLKIREIGPETGFSGSGTGFTFNRNTRQVILPSPQSIFRSLNGGSNWARLDLALPLNEQAPDRRINYGSYFVRQHPRNPQVLYAVTSPEGRLARSNDFGTTWTQIEDSDPSNNFYNFADIAVHEASPNVVLALKIVSSEFDGPALWRSEDGGATFTPQWDSGLPTDTIDPDGDDGCFPSYSNIAPTPADPNIVYVVQSSGGDLCPAAIHKSIDGGRTFARLEARVPGTALQVFPHPTRPEVLFVQTFFPINSSTIYRSLDGGASFQEVTGGLPNQSFFVSFDRHRPSLVYVAGRNGVLRSEDGGQTFQPLGLTAEQLGGFATNVNVDPSDSKVIYVNTFNGNFKSVNGGRTFQAINNGWRAASIRAFAFDNSQNPSLYLATSHGIMRTRTRGHNLEPVPGPSALNNTQALAVAPSNPNMILAYTRSENDVLNDRSGALYRTLDGGQSWTQSSVDTGPVLLGVINVDPQNFNNVYFINSPSAFLDPPTTPGVYKSVDAGATFELTVPMDLVFTDLAIDPLHPNVIFGGVSCVECFLPLRRSVDGGLSFGLIPGQMTFRPAQTVQILIDPQTPNNIFIMGGFAFLEDPDVFHYVLRSTDGGVTFSAADAGLPSGGELVMNPEDPARLYCGVAGFGLYVTSDSGNTWTSVSEIGGGPMLLNPKKPNLLYILGGTSVFEVEIHDN